MCACGCGKATKGTWAQGHATGRSDRAKANALKHGHASNRRGLSPTFVSWTAMIQRCDNPRNPNWADYGGRGITVCPRWYDFSAFLEDMGERPPGTSLDRKNNSEGYAKWNCRWATPKEQANNRRRPRARMAA